MEALTGLSLIIIIAVGFLIILSIQVNKIIRIIISRMGTNY
jgi:hypothetical protein